MWFCNMQAVHVYMCLRSMALTEEPSLLKFPPHVQLVCFGPDTFSCVYVWVKVRSMSAALVGTHRHLLCLPLCQTQFLYSHTDTHTDFGRPPVSHCVTLLGGNLGHVTCPKSVQPTCCEIESCLCQPFPPPFFFHW